MEWWLQLLTQTSIWWLSNSVLSRELMKQHQIKDVFMPNARSVSCAEMFGTHLKIQEVLHLFHRVPCCGFFHDEGDMCSTEQVQCCTKLLGGLSVWSFHKLFPFNIGLKRMKCEGGRDWVPQWVECSFLPLTVLTVPHIHCCKKSGL